MRRDMSDNMASVVGDRNAMQNSFDYFDQFLKSRSESAEEEIIEEEYIEEEIVDDSSSSYYEEEIEVVDDPLAIAPLRLDTVHENDSDEDSESDALWEDVSESFHNENVSASFHSEKNGSKTKTEELNTDSDMLARVRSFLNSNKIDEISMGDNICSESEGGGSSSVLPFDFDMGSDDDGEPDSSDEESEGPEDYEEACREMIATVHPKLDPQTMLHGCDLENLYTNLKQQYRHMLKHSPSKSDVFSDETTEDEPAIIEDNDTSASNFVELSFKSNSERSGGDIMSPEPATKTVKDVNTNDIHATEQISYVPQINNPISSKQVAATYSPPKVEKWLERNADDPEDFEYACRLLCAYMYDPNDHDYCVDTMLQRSTPEALYRYLKPHYWYLAHTNQLDENGVFIVPEVVEEEKEVDKEDTKPEEVAPSNNVEALRSFFANRTEMSERSRMSERSKMSERSRSAKDEESTNDIEMKEAESLDQSSKSVLANVNESNEDASENSLNDEMEMENTENEIVPMEDSPEVVEEISDDESQSSYQSETNYDSDDSDEEGSYGQNSRGDTSTSYSMTENDDGSVFVSRRSGTNDLSRKSVNDFDEMEESVNEIAVGDGLDDSTTQEDINIKSDESNEFDELAEEEIIPDNLDEKDNSQQALGEDVDTNDTTDDKPNNDVDQTNESAEKANCNGQTESIEKKESIEDLMNDTDQDKEQVEESVTVNNSNEVLEEKERPNRSVGVETVTNKTSGYQTTDNVDEVNDQAEEIPIVEEKGGSEASSDEHTSDVVKNNDQVDDSNEGPAEKGFHSVGEETETSAPCVDETADDLNKTSEHAGEKNLSNALGESTEGKETSDHLIGTNNVEGSHICDSMNTKHSSASTETNTIDVSEHVKSNDTDESMIDNNIQNGSKENTETSSEDNGTWVSVESEKVVVDDPRTECLSNNLVETEDVETENDRVEGSGIDEQTSANIGMEKVNEDEPLTDDIEDFELENDIESNHDVRNEGSVDDWMDEIDEPLSDSCSSLLEQYSREYNDIVARRKDDDFDENRFRLLEMSVRYIRGERLTEDEINAVEEFFDQETKLADKNEVSKRKPSTHGSIYGAKPFDDAVESKNFIDKEIRGEKCSLIDKNYSNHSYDPLQDNRSKSRSQGRRAATDPKELEWRKMRIEEDLKSIIRETEEVELRKPISSDVIDALNAGSIRTALTKKYYDTLQRDYIYYPSVAKSLKTFSLIEEAEKAFRNEFSFELATALCTIAAHRLKGSDEEVNEDDSYIQEVTVNVIIDEMLNQSTISFSESYGTTGGNSTEESLAGGLSDNKIRKKRIQNDLKRIIKDAEKNHLGARIEDEAIDALVRASQEIVFIKKYFDVDTDMFKYFPSVKNTILNCSLMERAEDFYFDGVQDFPLDYSSALRAAASRFRQNFVEVDERDTYVINMAVDVEIEDEFEGNQSEKCRDFSTTNDTASMMSSQTTEALVEAEKAKVVGSKPENDRGTSEASLNEKASLLNQRYLEDMRKIDEALVDLETEFLSESNRLDNEANEFRLKHKIEAERIEKDRRRVEEKALADEKDMTEQKEALLEKLSDAVATLELERSNANNDTDDMDTDEEEKEETRGWGWFNNKAKKNLDKEKQKQEKVIKLKLREVELEKDKSDIESQLDFVEQQAKAKKRNIKEWKAELKEEYRHLEALTSATEEKLKEEMKNLQASYEEEKQRLLSEKKNLEEIRSEDDRWLASEKKKMHIVSENLGCDEDDSIRSNTTGSSEVIPIAEGTTRKDQINNAENGDDSVVADHLALLNQPREITDEASLGSVDLFDIPEADDVSSRDLSTSVSKRRSAEKIETKPKSAEQNGHSDLEDTTCPITKGDPVVLDHLAHLNQPRETSDEASLGSVDLFDFPEASEVSTRDVATSSQKAKSEEPSGNVSSPDPPKEIQRNSSHKPRVVPGEGSKKRFLAAALQGKEQADIAVAKTDATPTTEEPVPRTPQTPRKSLLEMRRKVDEALEKAIAIRNGDSSSRHSRSIPIENESERSGYRSMYSPSPTPSRRSLNPMYPMIREADRLSGFIRRYEKKLETVCKSLLTLASVSGEEKDTLAARDLQLPEMLEFVTNQEWYKSHSKDSETPHLLFSRGIQENGSDNSAGDDRFTITATGKSFLEIDGPTPSDVSRFLTYLNKIEAGLTRDAMLAQWKEIAQLSGDEQSQRVCDKLDKLISFCIESKMIKK